jgi:hypothetical protein
MAGGLVQQEPRRSAAGEGGATASPLDDTPPRLTQLSPEDRARFQNARSTRSRCWAPLNGVGLRNRNEWPETIMHHLIASFAQRNVPDNR